MLTFGNALKLRRGGEWVGAEEGGPLFSDDFEAHTPGAGVPTGWELGGGTVSPAWEVSTSSPLADSQSLQAAGSGGYRAILATGVTLADVDAQLLLSSTATTDNQVGLLLRHTDLNNELRINANFAGQQLRFQQIVGGSSTDIATAVGVTLAINTTYRLRVLAVGTFVAALLYNAGGTRIATITGTTTLVTAGAVGMRFLNVGGSASTHKYDDVRILDLT